MKIQTKVQGTQLYLSSTNLLNSLYSEHKLKYGGTWKLELLFNSQAL